MEISEGYDKLMQYGLRLVSTKRYTFSGMRKKLTNYTQKHEIIEKEFIPKVMKRLDELSYLDDQKFVKDYVAQCNRIRPRGRMVLIRELKRKGVPKGLIESALEDTEVDDENVVFEVLSKRVRRWTKYSEYEQKRKAYQFLYSKGFSRDAIYKALDRCYNHTR